MLIFSPETVMLYSGDVMEHGARHAVRRNLFVLYILNIADWLCTMALLSSGGFYEANPLMRSVVGSIPMGFAVKVLIPAAAVAAVLRLTGRMDERGTVMVERFTAFVLAFYIALCVNHLINFVLLIFR